ncbi:MAG: cytochrome B [Gammaproteobacteria bacterium]|jgi:cytochrome b|nr:cytochrome B [Gammaproteobacteria bacterium]|tara:strand:- start:4732 stop:5409 length:678 start_codon:yes stop_codon:yes gene_type:complete
MTDDAFESSPSPPRRPLTLIWDWPLRLWHWLFALCLAGSLTTGLIGDIALMDWHLRLGYAALGLLVFRLGWALWGGRYARLATFRPSPRGFVEHFRGRGVSEPRSAPGSALVLLMLLAAATQAVTGLFTSDEIFTEGPLVRHASGDTVDAMSALHHRVFWVLIGLIGAHLTAHVIYGLRRDPTPLGMFTGRKPSSLPALGRHLPVRAGITAAAAAAAVWALLYVY